MSITLISCLVLMFSLSANAFAAYKDDGEVSPCDTQIWYISGTNVNFRSGPSKTYGSGGQLGDGDWCEPQYINGHSYFTDENGCTDENGRVYEWRYIRMYDGLAGGVHKSERGYVVSKYVKTRWVPSVD